MFYAVVVQMSYEILCDPLLWPQPKNFVFEDIKDATAALKRYKGSRMKTFPTRDKALSFLENPDKDCSFIELPTNDSSFENQDIVESLEKLSLQQSPRAPGASISFLPPPSPNSSTTNTTTTTTTTTTNTTTTTTSTTQPETASKIATPTQKQAAAADETEPVYPSAKPALLNQLRRKIEAGDYEGVEEIIWSNPRCLISVSDSAIYLMAGPKYNACHIAARANKPDIVALILDTITNFSFLRKLYPMEPDSNIQDRVNHLLDSYLNTPDPRQGNTPIHFACKLGHYRVVRVLLTFEGCDLSLRDSSGQTAEESTCSLYKPVFKDNPIRQREDDNDNPNGDSDQPGDSNNLNQVKAGEDETTIIKNKIKNMFKHQLHLPLFRDQLKKRLTLEKRRSRASSQMDSDTSFSDLDESYIFNSSTKP